MPAPTRLPNPRLVAVGTAAAVVIGGSALAVATRPMAVGRLPL